MQSYLSGRGASIESNDSSEESNFSSYLDDPSKKHAVQVSVDSVESEQNTESEVVHADESGIKVEVISVDSAPVKILVHIPDGRIIDLSCEY
jgi:hypothetical protein